MMCETFLVGISRVDEETVLKVETEDLLLATDGLRERRSEIVRLVLQDVDGVRPGTRYLNVIPEVESTHGVLKFVGESLTPVISAPTALTQFSELVVSGVFGRLWKLRRFQSQHSLIKGRGREPSKLQEFLDVLYSKSIILGAKCALACREF